MVLEVAGSKPVTHPKFAPLCASSKGYVVRYFLSVLNSTANPATDDVTPDITAFNTMLRDKGYLVMATGMHGVEDAEVFDNRGGSGQSAAGSYLVQDEAVVGFWILDLPDAGTARDIAAGASRACNRRIELRPLHG